MKDMIPPLEDSGFLDGQLITWPFNDTDDTICPVFITADETRIILGKIETGGTEPYLFLDLDQAFGKALGQFPLTLQDIERYPGGRFLTYSG